MGSPLKLCISLTPVGFQSNKFGHIISGACFVPGDLDTIFDTTPFMTLYVNRKCAKPSDFLGFLVYLLVDCLLLLRVQSSLTASMKLFSFFSRNISIFFIHICSLVIKNKNTIFLSSHSTPFSSPSLFSSLLYHPGISMEFCQCAVPRF